MLCHPLFIYYQTCYDLKFIFIRIVDVNIHIYIYILYKTFYADQFVQSNNNNVTTKDILISFSKLLFNGCCLSYSDRVC